MIKKLHIGSGKCYLPGYVNLDIFSNTRADVYADATCLPFDRESFDQIYCSHCLEHVHRHMVLATLSHWRDILKPSGVLRLAVPNFRAVCEHYQQHGNLDVLIGLLYGGQTCHLNQHTITFDEKTLTRDLLSVGFKDVRYWDWRTTEHAAFDDFSRAYLPHLDFENGKLMSLNLEATK